MPSSSRTPEESSRRCPVCSAELNQHSADSLTAAPCARCGHLEWFTWEDRGDEAIVKLAGRLTESEPWDRLVDSIKLRPGARLVLDFRGVDYVSSGIFVRLIALKRKTLLLTGSLTLRHVRPELLKIFEVTRLDHVFDFEN